VKRFDEDAFLEEAIKLAAVEKEQLKARGRGEIAIDNNEGAAINASTEDSFCYYIEFLEILIGVSCSVVKGIHASINVFVTLWSPQKMNMLICKTQGQEQDQMGLILSNLLGAATNFLLDILRLAIGMMLYEFVLMLN